MSTRRFSRCSLIVTRALLTTVAAVGLASAQDWSLQQVGTSGGWNASLAFNPAGNPAIGFVEGQPQVQVKFAEWNGSSWTVTALTSGDAVDLAFDSQGRACMSMKYGTSNVKFARRSGSRWTYESVDKNFAGQTTSLAFDLAGNPAIAYEVTRAKTRDLKLARFNGVTWSTQVVQAGVNAMWLSMAFDGTGAPAIAYSDDANGDGRIDTLKFAHWNGSTWVREVVDASVSAEALATYPSLAYDPSTGNPAIAYNSVDLPKGPRFAWWSGTAWVIEQVEDPSGVCATRRYVPARAKDLKMSVRYEVFWAPDELRGGVLKPAVARFAGFDAEVSDQALGR